MISFIEQAITCLREDLSVELNPLIQYQAKLCPIIEAIMIQFARYFVPKPAKSFVLPVIWMLCFISFLKHNPFSIAIDLLALDFVDLALRRDIFDIVIFRW
jgi:hypothetical protein